MSQRFTKTLGLIALTGFSALSQAQPFDWSSAGPLFTAGRSRNLVVDKTDPTGKTLYTGSASSGVFRSTNAGVKWTALNDQGKVRNISYMAQASDNTIYVATGEGFLRAGQQAKAQVGTGLYKINMATNSLDLVAPSSIVGTVINRIACSPSGSSDNLIVVAGNNGILISKNGGPFNPASGIATGSLTSGLDVKIDNNGVIYCSVGNEKNVPNSPASNVYKSTDAASFALITPSSSVLGVPNYGRIELAVAPSNNQVIYASCANKANSPPGSSSSLKGLFVSYNSGQTWGLILQGSPQLDPLTNGASIASGDYSHVIVVDPTNQDQIFIGGYYLFIFRRTGGSDASPTGIWGSAGENFFQNFQAYLHENIHDIKIVGPSTAPKFYIVTDAGIYRSIDNLQSFQPFYKGLVTGQFNSVSIETYPSSTNASTAVTSEEILANYGYIGGTGGNGLTYFNGVDSLATQETNFLSGDVYNAEFSKILPQAAFFSNGSTGNLNRVSNVRTSTSSDVVSVNSYTGALSKIAPASLPFSSDAFRNSTGTPFKLWENYGQVKRSPDSLVFYNDSARVVAGITSPNVAALTTQSTFTFSIGRPNKRALIDSIAIRTGTVPYDFNNSQVPVAFTGNDKKDIFIKLANNYPVTSSVTIPAISQTVGPVSAAGVTLNASSNLDDISVTFTSPPFSAKTTATFANAPDPTVYYKVFATVFYKYAVGDSITIIDNSISTKSTIYTFTLSKPLHWSKSGNTGPKPFSDLTNPIQKIAPLISARLALVFQNNNITGTLGYPAVVVSRAPLDLNNPLGFVRVSQTGALSDDANGVPTSSVINVVGKPVLLEWSKRGTELYFATDSNKLYRVSHLNSIFDLSPVNYSGKLSTDIFNYSSNSTGTPTLNLNSPYRTTLLGSFTKPITSIGVTKNDSMMLLTFNDPTGIIVRYSTNDIRRSNFSNIGFTSKTGTLTNIATYCSLIENHDNRRVFVGTDNGIFYTPDITASTPNWNNINNNQLPNVQIFDIKQQTLESHKSYNSGQIYVATNGRGVWVNKSFFDRSYVSVPDVKADRKENNLTVYPNPSNGNVYLTFNSVDGETASLSVFDLNGRLVKTENFGKLFAGQATHIFDTGDLSVGMYIVNVNSTSGIKRVAKLIVSK